MLRQQARVWPIIFDFKKEVEKTWKKKLASQISC